MRFMMVWGQNDRIGNGLKRGVEPAQKTIPRDRRYDFDFFAGWVHSPGPDKVIDYFMIDFFSDEMRRNPYPIYDHIRKASPVFQIPPPFDAWAVFDYDGAKRVLNDHEVFSSRVPAPRHWFLFFDPPQHTKLRGLISKAFTPKVITSLEPRIRELSRELLNQTVTRGE